MDDQTRNLRPHKPAVFAIYQYSGKFNLFDGGIMDFWDSLGAWDQRECKIALMNIEKAPTEKERFERFG